MKKNTRFFEPIIIVLVIGIFFVQHFLKTSKTNSSGVDTAIPQITQSTPGIDESSQQAADGNLGTKNASNKLPSAIPRNLNPKDSKLWSYFKSALSQKNPDSKRLNLSEIQKPTPTSAIIKKIERVARIEVEFPGGMELTELDMNDEVMTVFGSDPHTKVDMVFMAYPKLANTNQALGFVKEVLPNMPGMSAVRIDKTSEPIDVPPLTRNGISQTTVLRGTLSDGREINMALVTRADKAGSYMFVAYGPAKHFDEQEGYYDYMYRNLTILPKK